MTTAATALLGLALPVTAELQGTWGDVVNNSLTSLLDTAIAGTTTLSTDGDVTLSTTTLAANQARQAILLCSGARTAIRTITAPAQSKIYTIINATTGGFAVKLVGVGPTTGLTIPNGASAVVAWNGSDFIEIGSSTIGNLTVNGNLTVTGTSTLTGAATLTANPTLSAGTANGVAYLNGSKVVTTGTALTFDGTTFKNNAGGGVGVYGLTGSDSISNQFYLQNTGGTKAANLQLGSTGILQTWVYGGSSWVNATTIDSSGNLGIGTSSPSDKLQVTAGGLSTIFTGNDINFTRAGVSYITATGAGSSLAFGTANTAGRMTLDSSGNLGLGVTPSAWSGFKAFQTTGGAHFFGNTGAFAQVGANAYWDGSNYIYVTSAQSSRYLQNAGAHSWWSAASGTAGTAISFTQAMTLDASGNLGIGTSSPTVNLHVYNASSAEIRTASANIGLQLYSSEGAGTSVIGTYTNHALVFRTNATERARIDSSGNLLVGTTTAAQKLTVSGAIAVTANSGTVNPTYGVLGLYTGGGISTTYIQMGTGGSIDFWKPDTSTAARIDSSGNLLVGTTSQTLGTARISASSSGLTTVSRTTTSSEAAYAAFNSATSGNNQFMWFYTGDSGQTFRGSIEFNRGAGTVAYNTTSDYRAKDIIGPVSDSGAVIDSVPVYVAKMKGATQERPMFIAHETPEYAHTGEKDAVDEQGNPIYQQMDASALVPVIWAELQSLRKRVAQLEARLASDGPSNS